MRAVFAIAGSLVVALLGVSAQARPPTRRPPEAERRPTRGDGEAVRRAPEPTPGASPRRVRDTPWEVTVRRRVGCHGDGFTRLTSRLLALRNESDLMSLEVWGDAHAYAPYDQVLFYFRAPRTMYVTLYWIGPEGRVTVPVDNLRIPGHRDASVDTGGFIVPPFGREQWVALGTLEPVPLGCTSEDALLAGVEARLRVPHGVGRWEVWSADAPRKE